MAQIGPSRLGARAPPRPDPLGGDDEKGDEESHAQRNNRHGIEPRAVDSNDAQHPDRGGESGEQPEGDVPPGTVGCRLLVRRVDDRKPLKGAVRIETVPASVEMTSSVLRKRHGPMLRRSDRVVHVHDEPGLTVGRPPAPLPGRLSCGVGPPVPARPDPEVPAAIADERGRFR